MTPATRVLDEHGIEYEVRTYAVGDSGGEAARDIGRGAADALGLDHDRVLKTLLVDVDGGAAGRDPVVAVIPVGATLSMKALAEAVGAKRATMCDPRRAERTTGYVVGGISPLGQRRRLSTVVDASASALDVVHVSGGRRGLEISLAPGDLIGLLGAIVATVTA
ncbi:Cys-tRNA(Pro) deacylase [Ilumatobacter sp.]|uniref:Cys-tRNA(Pro) deacylase n=1 Tax=Ilumatobacter sp. TaxID=1967498 RepID=UPI003B52F33A